MQVTPSQRQFADAHKGRMDRLWPAKVPVAKQRREKFRRQTPRAPTAQEWFGAAWSLLDGPDIRLSIQEIQRAVCEHFHVPHMYMESSRRNHAHYLPRAAAIYLCKNLTVQSCPAIGRMFGNRDHTTILSCVNSVEKMIALRHPIARDIELITIKLGAKHE